MVDDISNDELIGRFDAAVAKSIKEQCTSKTRVHLNDIWLEPDAQGTLGNAIVYVSQYLMGLGFDISPENLKKYMTQEVFEIKGDLVFIFYIPVLDADQITVVPFGSWHYKSEKEEPKIQ